MVGPKGAGKTSLISTITTLEEPTSGDVEVFGYSVKNEPRIAKAQTGVVPLIYLSGVFFSLENLHPFWRGVSQLNPLLYLINGVRYGLLGVSDVGMIPAALVGLATLLVFHGVALRSLKTGSFVR